MQGLRWEPPAGCAGSATAAPTGTIREPETGGALLQTPHRDGIGRIADLQHAYYITDLTAAFQYVYERNGLLCLISLVNRHRPLVARTLTAPGLGSPRFLCLSSPVKMHELNNDYCLLRNPIYVNYCHSECRKTS